MTTTTSFSNANRFLAVFKQDLRRTRSLMIFYWVVTFVFFPLQYFLEIVNPGYRYGSVVYYNLYGTAQLYNVVSYVFFFPLMVIIPIIVAVNLLSYMQHKPAVDVYHAMPATRVQLMVGHFAAGMAIILGPLAVNYLLVAILRMAVVGMAGLSQLFVEFLMWVVVTMTVFALTALAAVCVGTSGDTILFSLGLNSALPLLYGVIMALMNTFVFGFTVNGEVALKWLFRLSPVILMVLRQGLGDYTTEDYASASQFIGTWTFVWFLLALAIMGLTVFLYRSRKSEAAETVDTRGPLKVVMKAIATFLGGTLFGYIFQGVFADFYGYNYNLGYYTYYIIGSIIGAGLIYMFVEVVLSRGFKTIKRNLIGCGAAMVAMGAFVVLLIGTEGFGYVGRMPNMNNVASVTVEFSGYADTSNYTVVHKTRGYTSSGWNRPVEIGSEAGIAAVREIHAANIADYKQLKDGRLGYTYSYRYVDITYKMKNGSTFARSYRVLSEDTNEMLTNLEFSPEYQEGSNPLLMAAVENITTVNYYNGVGDGPVRLNLSDAAKQELLDAARADLMAVSPREMTNPSSPAAGFLQVEFKDLEYNETYDYQWYALTVEESMPNIIAFMEKYVSETAREVDLSQFTRANVILQYYGGYYYSRTAVQLFPPYYNNVYEAYAEYPYVTTDPEEIAELYARARSTYVDSGFGDDEQPFILALYKEGDDMPSCWFFLYPEDVPKAIYDQQYEYYTNYWNDDDYDYWEDEALEEAGFDEDEYEAPSSEIMPEPALSDISEIANP